MKQIIFIVFEGRTWFDRVNGNTYHSRTIMVTFLDGTKKILTKNFEYGYGNQWYMESINDLVKEGIFETMEKAHEWVYANSNNVYITVNKVSKKKDLFL